MDMLHKKIHTGLFAFHNAGQGEALTTHCHRCLAMALIGVGAVFILAFSEALNMPEVALGFIAALVYYSLPLLAPSTKGAPPSCAETSRSHSKGEVQHRCARPRWGATRSDAGAIPYGDIGDGPSAPAMPVFDIVPPSPHSASWDHDVRDLLAEITPSQATIESMQAIVSAVEKCLQDEFPMVCVTGYAWGNPKPKQAFAAAMPEIDIVASVSTDILVRRLDLSWARHHRLSKTCAKKVHKVALRAFSQLLSQASFKFKRVALSADDPKICLMAPAAASASGMTTPIELTVNTSTPRNIAEFIQKCQDVDVRAKHLVLLVRRWARDRGIANVSQGYLPPLAWIVLAVFFLQHGVGEDGPVLPPFPGARGPFHDGPRASQASVADLFMRFFRFFVSVCDLKRHAVSLHGFSQHRARPRCDPGYPQCRAGGRGDAGPALSGKEAGHFCCIEDPFDTSAANLAALATHAGITRVLAELKRADHLSTRGAPLSEVLEPWMPDSDARLAQARGPAAWA